MTDELLSRIEIVCKDRDVGKVQRLLAGVVIELKSQPMVNATLGANGLHATTGGSQCVLFTQFCQEQVDAGVTELTPADIRGFLAAHNFRTTTISYALRCGKDFLKRRGSGNRSTYIITLQPTKPAKKRAKSKRK